MRLVEVGEAETFSALDRAQGEGYLHTTCGRHHIVGPPAQESHRILSDRFLCKDVVKTAFANDGLVEELRHSCTFLSSLSLCLAGQCRAGSCEAKCINFHFGPLWLYMSM